MTKTFKELAGLTEAKKKMSPEEKAEKEKIDSRKQYEKIFADILEDINAMKAYAKDKGLTNEEVSPLTDALRGIEKVDDLIRANFNSEDEAEAQEPEPEDKW